EDDVPVEDPAHLVGDRLLHVAAGDEHAVDRGDRAGARAAGPLEEARQHGEDARRIAVAHRRLAPRPPRPPPRAGAARERIGESARSSPRARRPRNHSATAVATNGDLSRTRLGASLAAHTTTERRSPSPRASARKSRTSRPRSPTRPMTLTSAADVRASCPRSIDLPAPDPANSPTPCPSPNLAKAPSARTPL